MTPDVFPPLLLVASAHCIFYFEILNPLYTALLCHKGKSSCASPLFYSKSERGRLWIMKIIEE